MRIEKVRIDNFRNLNEVVVEFNELGNYLIGENNLGKSNLLDALNIVLNGKKFDDEDFSDVQKNIEVILLIHLKDFEKGFFGDNFSPEDDSKITIKYQQALADSFPTALCIDTDETIPVKQLRKLHFVRYESTAVPTKELKIDSTNAAGKVFNGIVDMYLKDASHSSAFLNTENILELSNYVNEMLSRIKGFSQYGIKATVASNLSEMVSNLFFLSDGSRRIETTGSGIQYVAMVALNIVSQIMNIYQNKAMRFEEQLYTTAEGEKILPIIVALDEPEVHLHPYLQRSLIAYYKRILRNQEEDFARLLKECFGIDGLDGQLLIVTHSSDILIDDYKNIIRFYKQDEKTRVVSGMTFSTYFDKSAEKQLLMHFHELREAFYAHCVIIVEGETEYGCMPYFARSLDISLDNNCISIIMAQGESSIKPLKKLFEYFKIPNISIYDGDVRSKRVRDQGNNFFTTELCFEVEVIKSLYSKGKYEIIRDIAADLNRQAKTIILDSDYVKDGFKYLNKSMDNFVPIKLADIDEVNEEEFCTMYAVWFMKSKGVISGRVFGMDIPKECIPQCYVDAFNKALEIAAI